MKDIFYEQLQQAIQEIPSHDVLCEVEDLNARIGNDSEGVTRLWGRMGVENSLAIGGTLFPHREIQKMTWTSQDDKTHKH